MWLLLVKKRRADIVRTGDEFNLFSGRKTLSDATVVGNEGRRIAFTDKGQHAEQMMGAKPNGQFSRALPP